MDFGDVCLAGGFLKPEQFADEKKYPLRLSFCQSCLMVQIERHVDPEILFSDYFYLSSAIPTLHRHFTEYAQEIVQRFAPKFVVEIGSNDGVMLKPLSKLVDKVLGVEPSSAAALVDNIPVINYFFSESLAEDIVKEHGQADIIVANNVFAHISDINGFTRGVKALLKEDGVFIFEVHSLDKMVESGQYDWVYHEHLYYYSLLALQNHFKRHGMKIFDVKSTGLHAGSRRYFACKDARQETLAVVSTRRQEIINGLSRFETFQAFAQRARAQRSELMSVLNEMRDNKKKVVGYGACGRANTMIQYCGINQSHMSYIVDDAPAKHGFYAPGSHFEIKSADALDADYLLVFAWSFIDDIKQRCENYRGGMILPLPVVTVTRH